jgi:MazG family protein
MTQLQEPEALGRIVRLVRDLRARCSWDAAQTRETLRPYLVEEVLELDHAISLGNERQVMAELGDMLLHLAFQIVLGEENGRFSTEEVVRGLEEKMWRRHPHLFTPDGAEQTTSPEEPGAAPRPHPGWERQKLAEVRGRSMLDGLPPRLPALLMAFRLQERAAGVGFDWPDAVGPREKLDEEIRELDAEVAGDYRDGPGDRDRIESELGDILFAVVNLARKLSVDPRAALEKANRRFEGRFRELERIATDRGIELGRATLAELDGLWNEAKRVPTVADQDGQSV